KLRQRRDWNERTDRNYPKGGLKTKWQECSMRSVRIWRRKAASVFSRRFVTGSGMIFLMRVASMVGCRKRSRNFRRCGQSRDFNRVALGLQVAGAAQLSLWVGRHSMALEVRRNERRKAMLWKFEIGLNGVEQCGNR